jgi:hypothetical protein
VSVGVKLTYGSAEQETSFIFNMTTKEALGDLTYDRDNDGHKDREIVPVLLSEKSIAYLDLPIGASLLKEFFDVRLTIINNASSEFSMLDNVVTLNLPEGLSIVESAGSESNATVEINEIPGQSTKTVSWILRGDQEGEYSLSADYSGLLSDFDEPIYTTFLAKEPIKVYGLSNFRINLEVDDKIEYNAFYFNIGLENTGTVDLYCPRLDFGGSVSNITATTLREKLGLSEEEAKKQAEQEEKVKVDESSDSGKASGGQIFPDSSTRSLSDSEINSLSADQLQQAINEIWARNGYIFKSDYWNDYYSQFDWYHGTIPSDQFDAASNLNGTERDNCDRLAARRAQIGG